MKRKMAYISKPYEIVYKKSDIPQLNSDEILIKVEFAAICGSDLHLYKGMHPYVKLPSTIGHELVGRVVEVGENAEELFEGDLVVPEPVITCEKCRYCLNGQYSYCKNLSFQYRAGQAGFTDYFIVKEKWAHKVPKGINLKEAALTEPLAVAVHSVSKIDNMLGKDILIFGAGTIGLLITGLCKIMGCNKIICVDVVNEKNDLAKEIGATHTINPLEEDLNKIIDINTESYGVDVVFEATGSTVCIQKAPELIKNGGTIIQTGINTKENIQFPYSKIVAKEISLLGSQGYCYDFQTALKILKRGTLKINKIISHEFNYSDIQKAFNTVNSKDILSTKVLINFGEDNHE